MLPAMALFAFLLALVAAPPSVRAIDWAADRRALTDLYQAMGGAQWTRKTNWLASNISMCSWYGVVCAPAVCKTAALNATDIECRIVELDLGANNLQGSIAPAVQQLTNLTKLVLQRNAITGTIPISDLERADEPRVAGSEQGSADRFDSRLRVAGQFEAH